MNNALSSLNGVYQLQPNRSESSLNKFIDYYLQPVIGTYLGYDDLNLSPIPPNLLLLLLLLLLLGAHVSLLVRYRSLQNHSLETTTARYLPTPSASTICLRNRNVRFPPSKPTPPPTLSSVCMSTGRKFFHRHNNRRRMPQEYKTASEKCTIPFFDLQPCHVGIGTYRCGLNPEDYPRHYTASVISSSRYTVAVEG